MTSGEMLWRTAAAALLVVGGVGAGGWMAGVVGLWAESLHTDPLVRRGLLRATRPAFTAVAVIIALGVLQIDLMPAAVVIGAALFGGGTVLRGPVSDIVSGAVLVSIDSCKVGERIRCGEASGTVMALGLFAATLEQADGTVVTVPNHTLLTGPLFNDTRGGPRRIEQIVFVDGELSVEDERVRLLAAAAAVVGVLETPAPDALAEPTPDGVWLEVRVWVDPGSVVAAREALGAALAAQQKNKRGSA